MTSLTIGSSVAKIGEEAFGDCSGLKDIYSYIKQPEKVTMGRWVFNDVPTDECVLHVPKGTIPIYRECNQWKNFTNIVEMTVTGDLNGDELVDVSDVNMLIDMVLGKAEKDIGKADLNGDGIVDVSDVNAMIDIVLGRD